MEWTKIKNYSTKSFDDLFTNFCEAEVDEIVGGDIWLHTGLGKISMRFNTRYLYDFFDDRGIHIEIGIQIEEDDSDIKGYFVNIYNSKGIDYKVLESDFYTTRKIAERVAFEEAFKILEKQLNGDTKEKENM